MHLENGNTVEVSGHNPQMPDMKDCPDLWSSRCVCRVLLVLLSCDVRWVLITEMIRLTRGCSGIISVSLCDVQKLCFEVRLVF